MLAKQKRHIKNKTTTRMIPTLKDNYPDIMASSEIFPWDGNLETGLTLIDQHHRHLFSLVNELGSTLEQGNLANMDALCRELIRYAAYHFAEETQKMRDAGLSSHFIKRHTREHAQFIQQIKALHASSINDGPASAHTLLSFLMHWLTYHILGMDKCMARQIGAVELGVSPALAYAAETSAAEGSSTDHSANQMLLRALSKLYKVVFAHSQSLEHKVQERTRFLEESRESLARAVEDLRLSEERLRLATQANRIGMWELDLTSGALSWDDTLFSLYGRRREDFHGAQDAWQACVHPEDLDSSALALQQAIEGQRPFDCDFRILLPSGSTRHINAKAVVFCDADGRPKRMLGASIDITDRKNLENQLKNQAQRDTLTGLYNRRYFQETLAQAMEDANRQTQPLCVAMADLDHFKAINDTYGHAAGDRVLQRFGATLQHGMRSGDLVARLGGDEFAMLFPNADALQSKAVLERIRDHLSALWLPADNGQNIQLQASFGLADFHPGESPDQLLHRADQALYKAKALGGQKVIIFQ